MMVERGAAIPGNALTRGLPWRDCTAFSRAVNIKHRTVHEPPLCGCIPCGRISLLEKMVVAKEEIPDL